MPPGLLLALDTSSRMIGYALADGGIVRAEAMWEGQRQGTATLLAEVARALETLGRTQDDLRAVAVATGPGSFSGLRVGMGIAKGLALGLSLPLVGVPTLAVTAAPFRFAGVPVCALVAAGRSRFAYGVYTERDGELTLLDPVTNGTPAEIGTTLAAYPQVIVCGELADAVAGIVGAAPRVTVPPPGLWGRRPGALADLAGRRILRGELDDLVGLEPIYLHTSAGTLAGKG